MTSMFNGIGEATIGQGGTYFLDGHYSVELMRVFMLKTRDRKDLFIAECKILESDNEKRPVGSKASWCVNMGLDAALGNVKEFLAACYGADPRSPEQVKQAFTDQQGRDTTVATAEYSVSDANPMAGVKVRLEAFTKEKKTKKGEYFTVHVWSPYSAVPAAAQAPSNVIPIAAAPKAFPTQAAAMPAPSGIAAPPGWPTGYPFPLPAGWPMPPVQR